MVCIQGGGLRGCRTPFGQACSPCTWLRPACELAKLLLHCEEEASSLRHLGCQNQPNLLQTGYLQRPIDSIGFPGNPCPRIAPTARGVRPCLRSKYVRLYPALLADFLQVCLEPLLLGAMLAMTVVEMMISVRI